MLIHYFENELTEVRQGSLNFDSMMNPSHYESISVTWANILQIKLSLIRIANISLFFYAIFALVISPLKLNQYLHWESRICGEKIQVCYMK